MVQRSQNFVVDTNFFIVIIAYIDSHRIFQGKYEVMIQFIFRTFI